jgi:glycosyltransferase involved in cell wall biosynthesis
MKPRLSLSMIVKDEEGSLPICLESAGRVVDEIIIVDTGSTDSTKAVANRFGARLIDYKWRDNFSEARNVSLENCSGDWILVLDADEELVTETQERIRGVIESSSADGIEMIIRSEMPESDVVGLDEIRLLRLFRNRKEFRYSLPIHEQIRPAIEKFRGKIIDSDLVILHHGYARKMVQGKENRGERNLKILRKALLKSPNDPYLNYQLGVALMSTGDRVNAYTELRKVLNMDYSRLPTAILDRLFMRLSQLAVEMNDNNSAVQFAERSLQYNPTNTISKYVLAVGYLSSNRVADGYKILLKIQADHDTNVRLGNQLEHLIKACREVLGSADLA